MGQGNALFHRSDVGKRNGAVGYFYRDQGMGLDNMANTVRVFLGTSLECANATTILLIVGRKNNFTRWPLSPTVSATRGSKKRRTQ